MEKQGHDERWKKGNEGHKENWSEVTVERLERDMQKRDDREMWKRLERNEGTGRPRYDVEEVVKLKKMS